MNPEVKELWLARLRDPKSKATTTRLSNRDRTAFCCLGHLCEIAVEKGVIPEPVFNKDTFNYDYGANHNPNTLPIEVQVWAGLDESNPLVFRRSIDKISLGTLNDVYLLSLPQIADCIERSL